RPRRARKPRQPLPPLPPPSTAGAARSKLGVKYVCFDCEAKFYDLNRPEPLCPKCGADQRKRPKAEASKPSAPRARKPERSMAPLLDDDDTVVVSTEEVELGPEGVIVSDAGEEEEEEEESEEP
ncbi:MAG: FYDLN acid domain-containing protein, partial [Myxococcota bacterium]